MSKEKRYTLDVRYDITSATWSGPGDGPPADYTDGNGQGYFTRDNDRLSIQDSFQLNGAMKLTGALKVIDGIHEAIAPLIAEQTS